jgi:hypothetical protein
MVDSITAKKINIFRNTLMGDGPASDPMNFNDPAAPNFKDTEFEGAYITSIKRVEPEGIGNNQAAEKDDGNVQPLGIVELTYIVTGWISNTRGNADDGNNAFLIKLLAWKEDPQAILGVWEAGRFGIVDENDSTNNVIPIGTGSDAIGLIFQSFEKTNDYNRNRSDIVLVFRRSRGLDI